MELNFLRWLQEQMPNSAKIPLGIGDDAALLAQQTGQQTVVTTDMLMDGTDFVLSECGAFAAGRKAMAVNLSDLAAMGAKPVAAFISLAIPRGSGNDETLNLAQQLMQGLLPLAAEFECAIAGGDTNSWHGRLVICVTAIGEVVDGKAWRRSGAQPGDAILVTGSFGGSILGRHLSFSPRLRESHLLQSHHAQVHAAIDVSDGLSLDLSRICAASSCGAIIEVAKIPLSPAAHELAEKGNSQQTALDHALADGEDFELILAVPPGEAARLLREQPLAVPLTQIGWFTAEQGLQQQLASGELLTLQPRGYEH
ncbi:Thiamine-monophosphate kinase [Anatilimnocola aggregata]|uniref:Thiamine-monophosphate kinase n=1 Tax=Anatilimnocola aggregata TaxID=2528021 RepID=A0A517Y812_9BACT|nr:thiamine-phosphate kinase [Anatilimnocola aggregata]QDU26380.1 Thiamine-monophosphate kinase [Anatilimnocola aggregata]